MLKQDTVFVVGAGASLEFGLPIGSTLAVEISKKLDIRFDDPRTMVATSGDEDLFRNVTSRHRGEEHLYQQAAWLIRDGIILANSIDDFLDIHRHDHRVVEYGKAAIAKCILGAERRSSLFYDSTLKSTSAGDVTIDFAKCVDTWLVRLVRLLGRGRPLAERDRFFDGCSFIIFNYDRCVEHFFIHALQRLYKIEAVEAVSILSRAKIFHPYGQTGELDGIVGTGARAPFGLDTVDCYRIGETSIKTYSESVESQHAKEVIAAAKSIVFLGLAYHDQNLALLADEESLQPKNVIGTAVGMSNSDIKVVRQQLAHLIVPSMRAVMDNTTDIRRDLLAADVFTQYSKSL